MAYKFAEAVKAIELSTQNLKHLAHCDKKIRGVEASVPTPKTIAEMKSANRTFASIPITREQADVEIARLQLARKDIWKRLSKEEKAEYKLYVEASKPKTWSAEEQAAVIKQMDTNKDRASH